MTCRNEKLPKLKKIIDSFREALSNIILKLFL